ncbi:DUF4019 domain-containing protein [Metapseudomonas otitidis]|uniref:DUF4019 domain-containing protein n=1 Tax=Metapseudomonas otitidis TaxID=319939 RepID=UPI0025423F8A|nr:DUF4019 domain-containing protein [Pseudomonas otitidis]WIF69019.1 DUF4019 domain-containing protein [Pseudomonas otitidis]
MNRRGILPLLVGLLFSVLTPAHAAGEAQAIEQAKAAARAWLAVADREDYIRTWQQAASVLRRSTSQYDWVTLAVDLRSPLGGLKQRELQGASYATQLPGLPDGEYVILQYRSDFEHQDGATETVTPMRDSDGQWRVVSYFVD